MRVELSPITPKPDDIAIYVEERTDNCVGCPLVEAVSDEAARIAGKRGSVHVVCHQTWRDQVALGNVSAKGYTSLGVPAGYSEKSGSCQAFTPEE